MQKPFELSKEKSEEWMKRILKRAYFAGKNGEIPIAAVILNNQGHCIGNGSNRRENSQDPMGHAELIALRQAAFLKADWRFNECTLIVNLEPCQMCTGALIQARMGQVIYGASDLKRGGLGGSIDLAQHKSAHHKMKVIKGVLEEQASKQISSWFKERRAISF